jgi:PAS domain S-box-containing protein
VELEALPHPADYDRTVAEWARCLATGAPYEIEYRFREAATGHYRWFLGRALPQRDAAGRIVRWFGTCTDIHEQRLAAEGLAAAAERFAALSAASPVGIFDADLEGNVTYANPRLQAIWGAGETEMVGAGWAARVHPDDVGPLAAGWRAALAAGAPYEHEYRLVHPDGRVRVVYGRSAVVRDREGRAVGAVGTVDDVTAEREAEAARRASEARLRAVFEQAPVAVAVTRGRVAAELVFELANPHYRELVPGGRPVLGRPLREVLPEAGAEVLAVLQRVLDTGVPFTATEFCVPLDRDGDGRTEEYFFNVVYHPLLEGEGRPAGLVTVATEVTPQVRARRAAEEANRAKGQFLATMSHELRTPLNAIQGHVQILELGIHGPLTAEQRAALGRVGRAQRHLLGLINDVLNYARLESGRVEYALAPVDVAAAVADVLPMVEPQAEARGLRLHGPAAPGAGAPPVARADPEKLAQVLLNLLGNAVKFTPAGGRVWVEVATDGAGVRVRVADTGVGIPADKLEAVFEPFVQVRSDYAPAEGGTGLGLAISRDLARGMGGDLTAESVVGEGSTFTLTLPRAAAGSG